MPGDAGVMTGNSAIALDHLTVVDATPVALAELAAASGFGGVCAFLHSLNVLPHMPAFDLCADRKERRMFRDVLARTGLRLDVAYPFTLSRATDMDALARNLDCAAELGARFVNLLSYDRDRQRQLDRLGAFCDLARAFGLAVAIEFFPRSAIASLAEGLALIRAIARPGEVGLNVDLLHLMRSGGSIAELAAAPREAIVYAQLCDGEGECDDPDFEASSQRLLPGEGVFDVRAFVQALPSGCPMSLEIPQEAALLTGVSPEARALLAMESARPFFAA